MSTRRLTLDLHPIAKQGSVIDVALREAFKQVQQRKIKILEIIPGKGTGQLKKRTLKFLDRKDIKSHYDRMEIDAKNHGRIFVHFVHR